MQLVRALPGILAHVQAALGTARAAGRPQSPFDEGFSLPGAVQPEPHRCSFSP